MRYNHGFKQIGPTCGFYCMEMAAALLDDRDPDANLALENVRRNIRNKNSRVGEIFCYDRMLLLFSKAYPAYTITARRLIDEDTGRLNLDELMECFRMIMHEHGVIIFPVSNKVTPHYIVLRKAGSLIEFYDPLKSHFCHKSLKSLVRSNLNIRSAYAWKNFYKNKKAHEAFTDKILQLDKNNAKLYRNVHFGRKVLYHLSSCVDLRNRYFVVRQRDIV